MAPAAGAASAQTGVLPSVILAQWGLETAWGSSRAWTVQHNPAGIGWNGSSYYTYASDAAGVAGWVQTIRLPLYAPVRAAQGYQAQAIALGYSPWAGAHYIAPPGGPGLRPPRHDRPLRPDPFRPTQPPPPPEDLMPYPGPFIAHDDARQFIVWPNGTKTALGATTDGSTLTADPGALEWPYVPLSPAALDAIPG